MKESSLSIRIFCHFNFLRIISFMTGYVKLYEKGILKERIDRIEDLMRSCKLCPHRCGVNRMKGEIGFCRSGKFPKIASYFPHFGEERPLVGSGGSGTIFFSACNMKCVFCQNYEISQLDEGGICYYEELATIMINLQSRGCHNINLVSPTHSVYAILKALEIAIQDGLSIPLVYNTGGYDSVETVALLDGIVDIYLPDFKYGDNETAESLSKIKNYFDHAKLAIVEMFRQVGNLETDENGVARKGVMVRHLVLPNDLAGSEKVLTVLHSISKDIYINIMDQYRPCFHASEIKELIGKIRNDEFLSILNFAAKIGLTNIQY